MKTGMRMLAVLFAPCRQAARDVLAAPGEADCRWRAAATLGRAWAVNDEAAERHAPGGHGDDVHRERS